MPNCRTTVRHCITAALLLAFGAMHIGCQSVRVSLNKREPWLNHRALENEGLILLVATDDSTQRVHPQLAPNVGFLLAKDMKLTAVTDNATALAAAEEAGVGAEARRFADYFHSMHSLDHEALSAVSDVWSNTLQRGYVAVVSIEPPSTYHDVDHSTSETYDTDSSRKYADYQDYLNHRSKHVEYSETTSWTTSTRIIVRMYVVRIADQKIGWRIYVHGNFSNENSRTTTHDASDSFGQAVARSILESLLSGPNGFPDAPDVGESARQTLKRLAASLPR